MIWHICFHPRLERHWWGRKYGHVSIAGYHDDTWVHIDVRRETTDVLSIYRYEDTHNYLDYLVKNTTVVRFGPAKAGVNARAFLRPMSCVIFVKHTLGIRSRALLPDGLLRDLLRDYDVEIINDTQTGGTDTGPA